MSPKMRGRFSLAIFGILLAGLVQPVRAQKPLAIYVLDFDTNIPGDNRDVAVNLTATIETAFSQRLADFKVLERRKLNELASLRRVPERRLPPDRGGSARGEMPRGA